ncbi:VOC family protein [Thermoflavimicrobium dichotomicum]|uniref:Glyoxalase-like domain-containing protein n=1 Tax=Thermoflavimicrobium dichotomicum TaxID=46223 RepID=A0A1I3VDA2_9BACL|nr:VOC family protein [Thermoflavimicrobium dichotomicum]SFJ92999.1 Glyoxalase-like domain-containing protein [Thermoflavimicrobium dichotomicum]
MLRLDHFVVHIDEDMDRLEQLKLEIEPMGFPFNPKKGKETNGFKVSNIWIGDQYLELIWLKKRNSDWRKEWVDLYNEGKRGIFGLMLMTDDLDTLQDKLCRQGIPLQEPERITFKIFGLFKKTSPWRTLYTPVIPGTDLQIAIVQMDSSKHYDYIRKYFMKPNAEDNGITGIRTATVRSDFSQDAWEYLHKLFPEALKMDSKLTLDMGTTQLVFENRKGVSLTVELQAVSVLPRKHQSFQVENVLVTI